MVMTSKYAEIMKALGDDTRIKIFDMLRSGSMCANSILERFDFTQPTLSHHMKVLCDCGIVRAEKDGKWIHYSINCCLLHELNEFLGNTVCRDTPCDKNKDDDE